jgi:methionyl-tRNA formyltransferase
MKTAFLGYGEIGATVLAGLAQAHEVAPVITHRADFGGLGEDHVIRLAERLGLHVVLARNAGEPQVLDALRAAGVDTLVSANWRTTVPAAALEIPRLVPLNVHDALLPSYAGFGSVNWSIRNGEDEIGLTVHVMEPELDTGPVVYQVRVPISETDTAGDVYLRLLEQYPGAVLRALELLAEGVQPVPQKADGASFYHRITARDVRLDWNLPTRRLVDLIRSQIGPYVPTWFELEGTRVFVTAAAVPRRAVKGTPGRVVRFTEGGVAVACGPSWDEGSTGVIMLELQLEGADPVPAASLLTRLGVQLS